jgi:hypothetical protein
VENNRGGRSEAPGVMVLACAIALSFGGMTMTAGAEPSVEELLARLGERLAEFYKQATNVICIETSTVQAIDSNNSAVGFARTVESELHFEAGDGRTPADTVVVRKIRRVNGRAPRDEDKRRRDGCTDPNPLSSEPLTFLLPDNRSEYTFKTVGTAKNGTRVVLMIDFASVNRRSRPVLIEDPGGHDDCFDWSGHIASRGRIWVDADNHDILRVERGLPGPVDVRVPVLIQHRHRLENWIAIVRDDVTIRYKRIAFSDPDEILLLPESIHSLTVVRGGLESTRRTQTFSGYRRFVTGGRVLQ